MAAFSPAAPTLPIEGHSILEVTRRINVAADTVRTWRRRFIERGLDGLSDDPRPGAPRKISDADVERLMVKTLEAEGRHPVVEQINGSRPGMSQSAISRIWRAFALAPHRYETLKLSTDPFFIDRVRDVMGLYLDPPERVLTLCVGEKGRSKPWTGPSRSSR